MPTVSILSVSLSPNFGQRYPFFKGSCHPRNSLHFYNAFAPAFQIVERIKFLKIHLQILTEHIDIFFCDGQITMPKYLLQTEHITTVKNPIFCKCMSEGMARSFFNSSFPVVTAYQLLYACKKNDIF